MSHPLALLDRALLTAWDAVTDRRGRLAHRESLRTGRCACGDLATRPSGECARCWLDRQY